MIKYKVRIYEGIPEDSRLIKEEVLDRPPKTIFVGDHFVTIDREGEKP
jgi:hypothetical protein